jgi:hypothetical protein
MLEWAAVSDRRGRKWAWIFVGVPIFLLIGLCSGVFVCLVPHR